MSPYDIISIEARELAKDTLLLLVLHDPCRNRYVSGGNPHSDEVHHKSHENLLEFIRNGWRILGNEAHFQIYAQPMSGQQHGIEKRAPSHGGFTKFD